MQADRPDRKPDEPASSFVLALSWSPEFCRFRNDAPEHAGQCRDNDFGFIVHGLWAQGNNGVHPRACALAPPVSEPLVREHYCMTPSARLMQRQWAAHGTCAFASADAYFAAAARLWAALNRPDLKSMTTDDLTAGDVRSEFTAANPALPREAIFIDRTHRGWLEEVRICFDRRFTYTRCGDAGAPDRADVLIWRGGRPLPR